MNAQELAELKVRYDLDKYDIVQSPGKFEGEWLPTVYFWDLALGGEEADRLTLECGLVVSVFAISGEDINLFPDLAQFSSVAVWEDDSGFVQGKYYESCHALYKDWEE